MKKPTATGLMSLVYLGVASAQAKPVACTVPSATVTSSVTGYVFQKYHVALASQLMLLSNEQANDDCYWKYRYQVSPSKREIVLYLAPDHRYLTTTLYDRTLDPLAEEKLQQAETAKALVSANSASLGKKDASVTLVEFSDFECPFCQRLTTMLEKEIVPNDPDVRVVFRNYPLAMHPWAEPAAQIAACAQMQGDAAFWRMHDYIFANQREITAGNVSEKLLAVADAEPSIKRETFHACVDDGLTMGPVKKDVDAGNRLGVHATPTVFVNGHKIDGVKDAAQLKQLIAAARAQKAATTSAGAQESLGNGNSK